MEILRFMSHNHLKTLARAILSLQGYQLLYMLIGSAIVHADALFLCFVRTVDAKMREKYVPQVNVCVVHDA